MLQKRNIVDIMISDKADEAIKKLFGSLKNRYQNNLDSMRGLSSIMFGYCFINVIKQI